MAGSALILRRDGLGDPLGLAGAPDPEPDWMGCDRVDNAGFVQRSTHRAASRILKGNRGPE
jgi:hypothetical protein